jgi:hypothetical protein
MLRSITQTACIINLIFFGNCDIILLYISRHFGGYFYPRHHTKRFNDQYVAILVY